MPTAPAPLPQAPAPSVESAPAPIQVEQTKALVPSTDQSVQVMTPAAETMLDTFVAQNAGNPTTALEKFSGGEPPLEPLMIPNPNLNKTVITEEKPIAEQSLKQEPTPVAEQPIDGQYTEEPATNSVPPEPEAINITLDSTVTEARVADIQAKLAEARANPDFAAAELAVRNSLQRAEGYEPVGEEEIFRRTMQMAEKYKQRRESAPPGGKPSAPGEAPVQPPDTVINVAPDMRLEESRNAIAAQKAEYEARIAKYEATIAELMAEKAQNSSTAENVAIPATTPPAENTATPPSPDQAQTDADAGPDQTPENKVLTEEQKALVDRINQYVEKLRSMKIRGIKELNEMMRKDIGNLVTKLESELDVVNHPERAQQLESILRIMGGSSIEEINKFRESNEKPNLNSAIINLLQRFTSHDAKLTFNTDVPKIQATIEKYVTDEELTPSDLEALRAAIGKTDDELNKSPLGEIMRLIILVVGHELFDATTSAVTSQQGA